MSEELKLLPCPACQSKTEFYSEYGRHGAGCHKCGIGTRAAYSTEERAAEVWNSLPRAMVWTTEPPKEAGHYWCRYTGSDKATWTPAYIPAVGDLRSYDMEKHERVEWAGPIPTPREPTE